MGIDKSLTMLTFILGAVYAAIGGILFAARAGAVQINSVDSKLLDAITIAVFSGVIFSRFQQWHHPRSNFNFDDKYWYEYDGY